MNAQGRQQHHLPEISEFTAQSTQYASSSSEYAHCKSAVSRGCSKLSKVNLHECDKICYVIFYFNSVEVQRTFVLTVHTTKKRKGKGKAIPLQALTDPEGSSRLRLPDFKTTGT
jgi:hypothetical protein